MLFEVMFEVCLLAFHQVLDLDVFQKTLFRPEYHLGLMSDDFEFSFSWKQQFLSWFSGVWIENFANFEKWC